MNKELENKALEIIQKYIIQQREMILDGLNNVY